MSIMLLYFIFLLFVLSVFIVFLLAFVSTVVALFTSDVPFVATPQHIEDFLVDNLVLSDTSVLYDLGCGDGHILKRFVDIYPHIQTIGVDIAFIPYFLANFYTRKYRQIKIKRENIFTTDMSSATHIFLYLYPEIVNKLIYTIQKQCAPGTEIISCDFEITSLKPVQVINFEDKFPLARRGKKLFIYKI